ncbi:hypothetical protein EC988_005928 [Linderina pennispora]|nr:hypothetical protein EC988_005928 [Linderina pennispora]
MDTHMDIHMDTDDTPATATTQQQPEQLQQAPVSEPDFIAAAEAVADYESSDLSSSSDSDSDSDSEAESKNILDMIAEADDDIEDSSYSAAITSRNEILRPEIPAVAIAILPATQETRPLGTVYSIVNDTVIIESAQSGVHSVLDVDAIVAFSDRSVLGQIFEVFGPVARPMYSVRFNDPADIDREKCVKGALVIYAVGMANVVATDRLRTKGYDASNEYDEEVNENEMEFSDDEKELEHRRQLRARVKQQKAEQKAEQREKQTSQPPARKLQSYGDLYDADLGF